MKESRILIYNDSPIFGGHELMTINMANILSKYYDVYFLYFYPKIGNYLNNKIKKIRINISSKPPLASFRIFNLLDLIKLKAIIKSKKIDLTIVSQGTIELSLKGAIVSKWLGIKTVSYIPLCFPSSKMGIKFGKIRDIFNKRFYYLFDAFITISDEQKELIKIWNKNAKVFVLPNLVKLNHLSESNYCFFKNRTIKIGVVGRISFKQKGQDKLIEIAKLLKKNGIKFLIFVIGEGPDKRKLQNQIKREKLDRFFVFTGWIDDKKKIYNIIDLLLITSNFEGVPLNMLEALIAYKPVLAPYQGIFKEYLSEDFLYEKYEDIPLRINKLIKEPEKVKKIFNTLRLRVLNTHNEENFEKTLMKIISGLLNE